MRTCTHQVRSLNKQQTATDENDIANLFSHIRHGYQSADYHEVVQQSMAHGVGARWPLLREVQRLLDSDSQKGGA